MLNEGLYGDRGILDRPDRKLAFLAALSYHLTYIRKAKVFKVSDLIDAYGAENKNYFPFRPVRQPAWSTRFRVVLGS